MWNNFGDITKKLAEKAAAAAENIEGQLNQSVGATPELLASVSKSRNNLNNATSGSFGNHNNDNNIIEENPEEDPFYNDDFYEDDDDSFDVDMHDDDNNDDRGDGNENGNDDGDGMKNKQEQEQDTATDTAVGTDTEGLPMGDSGNDGLNIPQTNGDLVTDADTCDDNDQGHADIPRVIQTEDNQQVDMDVGIDTEVMMSGTSAHESGTEPEIQEEGLYDETDEDYEEEEVNFDSFVNEAGTTDVPQEIEVNNTEEDLVPITVPSPVPTPATIATVPSSNSLPKEIEVVKEVEEIEATPEEIMKEETPSSPSMSPLPPQLETAGSEEMMVTSELVVEVGHVVDIEETPEPEEELNLDRVKNDSAKESAEAMGDHDHQVLDQTTSQDVEEEMVEIKEDITNNVTQVEEAEVQAQAPTEHGMAEDMPSVPMAISIEDEETNDHNTPSEPQIASECVDVVDEGIVLPNDMIIEHAVQPEDNGIEIDQAQSGGIDDSLISTANSEEELSIYVTKEEARSFQDDRSKVISDLELQVEQLMQQLHQREDQLTSKVEQMTVMTEMFEQEKKSLVEKVKETKEEAKKRIGKAKEKVQSVQNQLAEANARANSADGASSQQDEIITALRSEGEKLARKQSEMEQLVREARGEMRDLKLDLKEERNAKEMAEDKIAELESKMKKLNTDLSDAKERGGLAEKLDSDLLVAREEREKNASIILGLQAELKEVKGRNNEMRKEMEKALKDKVAAMEFESSSIRREKDSILQDLEMKLRTSERDANLREDSLRNEVAELRKRWQESVRRCDALSIDLQQSSAPLIRQLESTERQGRARAAAWAELESKLRSDLEENVIQNETLTKEKNELETKMNKLNRELEGKGSDLSKATSRLDEMSQKLKESSSRYDVLVKELDLLKVENTRLEQLLENNESKARSEMTERFRESEGRYNDHIESLEVELRQEREKRSSLEEKITEMISPEVMGVGKAVSIPSPKRNLGKTDNQAAILQDTLLGLGGEDASDGGDHDAGENEGISDTAASGSFAFIEQLSQALKASKLERDTLRKQLDGSEERRTELENAAVANQEASKKLPALEKEVSGLKRQVLEKDREIQGLQEDIIEVRQMYRTQLDALLSDAVGSESNGNSSQPQPSPSKPKPPAPPSPATPLPTSFTGMRTF